MIGVYWVGWSLNPDEKRNKDLQSSEIIKESFVSENASIQHREMFSETNLQVNAQGDLFRLSEWAAYIIEESKNSHIVLMDDYQLE